MRTNVKRALFNPPIGAVLRTVLHLRGDGSNGSTSILDSNSPPKTIVNAGGATISDAIIESGFSEQILLADASNNTVSYAGTVDDFVFVGSGGTIEFFLTPTNIGTSTKYFCGLSSGTGPYFQVEITAAGAIGFYFSGSSASSANGVIANNTRYWIHVEFDRGKQEVRVYVNGTLAISGSPISFALPTGTITFHLNRVYNLDFNGSRIAGRIEEFRLMHGVRRSSTVPTTPL